MRGAAGRRDDGHPIFDTVLKGISIIGSIVGTRQDLAEVFALHAAGRTRVVSVRRALADVNAAMADVLAGRVPARIVLELPTVERESLVVGPDERVGR